MRQRGFWFKRVLIFTILMTFAPMLIGVGYFWIVRVESHRFPMSFNIGIFRTQRWSPVAQASTMTRNRWLWTSYGSLAGQTLRLYVQTIAAEPSQSQAGTEFDPLRINPDVVEKIELAPEAVIQFPYFSVASDATQAYLVGKAGEVLELHGDHLSILTTKYAKQFNSLRTPPVSELPHVVVADGRLLAFVKTVVGKQEVFEFQDETWNSLGDLELLDTERVWLDAKNRQLFVPVPAEANSISGSASSALPNAAIVPVAVGSPMDCGTIKVITIDSQPFLFWQISNRLLFRKGLALNPLTQNEMPTGEPTLVVDDSASALNPTNTMGVTSDWTAVADLTAVQSKWFPVAVGGNPAVILVDESKRGHPRGIAFRFDQDEWEKFASTDLPFASYFFNSGFLDDGSMSYLAAVTIAGRPQVLALELSGFRATS